LDVGVGKRGVFQGVGEVLFGELRRCIVGVASVVGLLQLLFSERAILGEVLPGRFVNQTILHSIRRLFLNLLARALAAFGKKGTFVDS
jgi:hypothetical protein